jgi:transcription-repair coupling factor (superfamily II helicase)
MTEDARKRIQALEQFSELEADLISRWRIWDSWCRRLLGGEQSGFINEIGFDTYQKNHERSHRRIKRNEQFYIQKKIISRPRNT